jgi:hypothetical protein
MRENNSLKLSEVRAGLPDFSEAAKCAAKLKAAMFEGVSEHDVAEIMKTFVAKAKAGDAKAAKVVFDVIAQSSPKTTVSVGVRANRAGEGANGNGHYPASRLVAPPSGHAIRLACARALGKDGPATIEDLADETEFSAAEVEQALAFDADLGWFEKIERDRWRLTTIGRKEALETGRTAP